MINCDICGAPLIQTGNVGIFTCKETSIWIEDRKRYLEIRHTTCHVFDNKITYKLIDVFPYEFHIDYVTDKTTIFKKTIRSIVREDKNVVYTTDKKSLLEIDHIMDLPWNDQEQVIQKLKLYSIFS